MKKRIILFFLLLLSGAALSQTSFAQSISAYGYDASGGCDKNGICSENINICWNISVGSVKPGYFLQITEYQNGVYNGPIDARAFQACQSYSSGQTTQDNLQFFEQYFNGLHFVLGALFLYPDGSQISFLSNPLVIINPVNAPLGSIINSPAIFGSYGQSVLADFNLLTLTKDPVNIATGEDYFSSTDFSLKGQGPKLALFRQYRSFSTFIGMFGYGWRTDFDANLSTDSSGDVTIYDGKGTGSYFMDNSGTYTPSPGNYSTIVKNSDSTYTVTDKHGNVTHYNINGRLTSRTDRNGNILTFVYSPTQVDGTYIQDASGRKITLNFDSNGHVISAVDPAGKTFQYGYDTNGNLVSVTDPTGAVTNYVYNSNHQIIQFINANGHNTYYQYDTQGRCVMNYRDNNVNKTTLNYEANNTTVVMDSLNNSNTYVFNNYGLLTSHTDPMGNVTQQTWDLMMNLLSQADARNNATNFTYDGEGNLVQITDPLSNQTTMAYTPNFNLISTKIDALNNTTNYTYDVNGNLISIIDALNKTHSFVYDEYGNVIAAMDSRGNTTNFAYDALGHLIQKTDALGNSNNFTYE